MVVQLDNLGQARERLDPLFRCEAGREWSFLRERELGRGTYGRVHLACRNSDCGYVAKWEYLAEAAVPRWHEEVRIAKVAARKRIAPRVYDSWLCRGLDPRSGREVDVGVTINEQMDGSFNLLLNAQPLTKRQLTRLFEDVRKKVDALHAERILHLDLHLGNILFKRAAADGARFEVRLTDFGMSIQYTKSYQLPPVVKRSPRAYVRRPAWDDGYDQAFLTQVLYRYHANLIAYVGAPILSPDPAAYQERVDKYAWKWRDQWPGFF